MTDAQLSPRQHEVLQFINAFRAAEQRNPTRQEIAEGFGWSSPNAAEGHLSAMVKKGVLRLRGRAGRYVVAEPFVEVRA